MKEYNAAFFGVYENLYKVLYNKFGEGEAVEYFRAVMEMGLKKAYDALSFQRGNVYDFVRILEERDNSVGLLVKFPEVKENRVIYQFYIDPFPGLKGLIPYHKLDDTYINFKINYLLGSDWHYETTKHLWEGDPYTEFTIIKNRM